MRTPQPPERCNLRQAALWTSAAIPPIADELFNALPPPLELPEDPDLKFRDLLLVLRSGALEGRADLHFGVRVHKGRDESLDDFAPLPDHIDVVVPKEIWLGGAVDWDRSLLRAQDWKIARNFTIRRLDRYQVAPSDAVERMSFFSRVTVNVAQLFDLFPSREPPKEQSREPPKEQRHGGGRPEKYAWKEFYEEVISRVHNNGYAPTQAKFAEEMLQWCEDTWEQAPGLTEIKNRVRRIFRRLQEGGN